jgi:SLOG cluster3 family
MVEAIFLSAGVPDPKRGPQYAKTADTVAITAAVSALVHVTLGRRLLIWGGQPAITPMIWVVAEAFGLDYGSWVKLYQTRYFEDQFPEDNERFRNVIYTEVVEGDRQKSLQAMRERMFTEHRFAAAVFVGGMGGIIDEFDMFQQLQPESLIIPILSTGGAALELANRLPSVEPDLMDDLDYVGLFHRKLGIDVKELRFVRREDQPSQITERLWRPVSPENS